MLWGNTLQGRERSGLVFALAGFALLSVGDAVVKSMAGLWPGLAIAALRYVAGVIGLGVVLALREGRAGFRMARPGWQMLRGGGVALSAMAFFTALFLMPIATATAITFTSPMITGLLAALILREPMRRATWIASAFAFAGVLIVLRPNLATLGAVAFLPLLSATGMALLMIGNRAVAGHASALAMQFSVAFFGTLILVPAAIIGHFSGLPMLHIGVPEWSVAARSVLIACSASLAHTLVYMATTRAGAATIAPMTYVQLLMAGFFGWLLFRERPDATALFGAAVIVAAGLYLWNAGRAEAPPRPGR